MRLTRCALAAATVAASASAVALPFFHMHWTSRSSDVAQVRMVSAVDASRSGAKSPEPSVMDTVPVPQASARPCHSYGGPYCGWVEEYRGGCDWVWGLSYGINNPDVLCLHDPRPSPSAAASSSAAPSHSESTASFGIGGATRGSSGIGGATRGSSGIGGTTAGLGRLAGPKHKHPAEPHCSAASSPTALPSATATSAPVGHRPQRQSFPTGPARTPSTTSSTGDVHAPAVEPQVLPGEGPDTASLLQAVHTAAEGYVFPYVLPFPGVGPLPIGTTDAAAPLVP